MMIGSQNLLMTLGVNAKHNGKPLTLGDVEVLGMNVRSNWNGNAITAELEDISKKAALNLSYAITDNASTMNKDVAGFNFLNIRDIRHTLGVIMKRIYDKDEECNSYTKEIALVKFKSYMNYYNLTEQERKID
ncbi:MAG: hypothetical protein FWG84_09515 [Bacteroidales bacterium]|nr:hypothetical protein [Bacteroidales bacterium]